MTNHFYIHIPFCKQRCPYCKFALTPVFDEFKKKRYIEYLKKEIRAYFSATLSFCEFGAFVSEDFREKSQTVGPRSVLERGSFGDLENKTGNRCQNEVEESKTFDTFGYKSMKKDIGEVDKKTIYFGGGTPSVLAHGEILEILECFPFYKHAETEISLEANPEDITIEYIDGLLALGINRISLGVQTLNEVSLKEIHRSDQDTILSALSYIGTAIGKSGKQNISINVDLILGLPYTGSGEILASIHLLHARFPHITHTSVYMLEDEIYPKHWKTNSISDLDLQSEFINIIEYFQSKDWNHYELSNFSKPGYESVHNRAYWDHSHSRGFGLSAASHEHGRRWSNSSSFSGYFGGKITQSEVLSPEQVEIEIMMFSLRTSGWDMARASIGNTGKIEELTRDNLLEIVQGKIKPTKTGIFVIDHIMSELIADS